LPFPACPCAHKELTKQSTTDQQKLLYEVSKPIKTAEKYQNMKAVWLLKKTVTAPLAQQKGVNWTHDTERHLV
jgi:hypothetical protein